MNIRSISELKQTSVVSNTLSGLSSVNSFIEISRKDNNNNNNNYHSEKIDLKSLLQSIDNKINNNYNDLTSKMKNLSNELTTQMDNLDKKVIATEQRMNLSIDNLRTYLLNHINNEMKKYLPLSGGTIIKNTSTNAGGNLAIQGNFIVDGSTTLNNTNIPTGTLSCNKTIEGTARQAMWA